MNRKRNQEGIFSHEAQGYSQPLRSRSADIYRSGDNFGDEGHSSKPNNPNRTFSYPYTENDSRGQHRYGYSDDRHRSRNFGNDQYDDRWPESDDYRESRGEFGDRDRGIGLEYNPIQTNGDRFRSYSSDSEWRSSQESGQHRGKGPKGYQRSDERIRDDIHDRLTDDSFVDATNIEVNVINGDVTLTGTVDQRTSKRRAEDISENVSGVRNVENRLRIVGSSSVDSKENASGRNSETTNRTRRQEKFSVTGLESN